MSNDTITFISKLSLDGTTTEDLAVIADTLTDYFFSDFTQLSGPLNQHLLTNENIKGATFGKEKIPLAVCICKNSKSRESDCIPIIYYWERSNISYLF